MTDIVCTLTDDDARDRLAEYGRLLAAAYAGRERTTAGMRWWLRADPGIAGWARDLTARERACCAFLTIGAPLPVLRRQALRVENARRWPTAVAYYRTAWVTLDPGQGARGGTAAIRAKSSRSRSGIGAGSPKRRDHRSCAGRTILG